MSRERKRKKEEEGWIPKIYVYPMEYYLSMKRKEVLIDATA